MGSEMKYGTVNKQQSVVIVVVFETSVLKDDACTRCVVPVEPRHESISCLLGGVKSIQRHRLQQYSSTYVSIITVDANDRQ